MCCSDQTHANTNHRVNDAHHMTSALWVRVYMLQNETFTTRITRLNMGRMTERIIKVSQSHTNCQVVDTSSRCGHGHMVTSAVLFLKTSGLLYLRFFLSSGWSLVCMMRKGSNLFWILISGQTGPLYCFWFRMSCESWP